MTDFRKEFKLQTRKLWLSMIFVVPALLGTAVGLVYANVPFHINMIVDIAVGLTVFFIFQLIYDNIQKKKEERRKTKKGKDPFAD